jgi:hypothetical protein
MSFDQWLRDPMMSKGAADIQSNEYAMVLVHRSESNLAREVLKSPFEGPMRCCHPSVTV